MWTGIIVWTEGEPVEKSTMGLDDWLKVQVLKMFML